MEMSFTYGTQISPCLLGEVACMKRITAATRVCCSGVNRCGMRSLQDSNAVGCEFTFTITRPHSFLGSCLALSRRMASALSSAKGTRAISCRFDIPGPRTALEIAILGRLSSGMSDGTTTLGSPDLTRIEATSATVTLCPSPMPHAPDAPTRWPPPPPPWALGSI